MPQSLADMVHRDTAPRRSGRRPEQLAQRTRRQTIAVLKAVPLFEGFSNRHLARLAREADELVYHPGEHIVEEGSPGLTLFVALSGQAKVQRGKRRVGTILPGHFFGELSAIDGGYRTASVVAETDVQVLRLFRRTLMSLLRDEPQLVLKLLDGIVRRMREVDRGMAR